MKSFPKYDEYINEYINESKREDIIDDTLVWCNLIYPKLSQWRMAIKHIRKAWNFNNKNDIAFIENLKNVLIEREYLPGAPEIISQIDDIIDGKYGKKNLIGDRGLISEFMTCMYRALENV